MARVLQVANVMLVVRLLRALSQPVSFSASVRMGPQMGQAVPTRCLSSLIGPFFNEESACMSQLPCTYGVSLDRLDDSMGRFYLLSFFAVITINLPVLPSDFLVPRASAQEEDADESDFSDSPASVGTDDEDEAERLSGEVPADLPDSSVDLSVDVDRWVLHDVLQHGPAQSRPWRERLTPPGYQLDMLWQQPAWPERLQEARRLARLQGEPEQHHDVDSRLTFDIPLANHPLVDLYIDYFTGRGRIFFEKWLSRSARYVPMMQQILAERGVPRDLVYVAMIESGFSASAYSSAKAAGYWQFMGPTGRLFGLKRDAWVDERRDFVRATEAAAQYMAQLYKQMGDWHLAWASYNAGEGRVRRALDRYNTHDFWELIENRRSLAKETVHYVPKIIAAAIIAKDAARFGFTSIPPMEPLVFDEIPVRDAVDLRRLATRSGVSIATLRDLNPALLHDVTPPNRPSTLRVPVGRGMELATLIATLPPSERLTYWMHKVRPGESLSSIARRYRTNIQAIRDMNNLKRSHLRVGQQLMVAPIADTSPKYASHPPARQRVRAASLVRPDQRKSASVTQARVQAEKRRVARHVVSAGDTLWSIARRYGVSVEHIRSANAARRSNRLAIGEVLDIF